MLITVIRTGHYYTSLMSRSNAAMQEAADRRTQVHFIKLFVIQKSDPFCKFLLSGNSVTWYRSFGSRFVFDTELSRSR